MSPQAQRYESERVEFTCTDMVYNYTGIST